MGRVRGAMGRKRHRFQNEMSQNRRSGATGGGGRESGTNIASEVGEPSNLKGRTTRRGEVRAEVVSERYDGAPRSGTSWRKTVKLAEIWRCRGSKAPNFLVQVTGKTSMSLVFYDRATSLDLSERAETGGRAE